MSNNLLILTQSQLENAIDNALHKIRKAIPEYSDGFPSAASTDGIYGKQENKGGWTQSFWTGMLWLAYEFTGDNIYKDTVQKLLPSFANRVDNMIGMNDHDIGFVFTLSMVAGYKITGDKYMRQKAIDAARVLANRFREKGQFIQLAGDADCEDPKLYRLIIDCLMNVHLLFWAGEETGEPEFTRKAIAHVNTTLSTVVRDDGSTFQNFYFDQKTGERLGGGTKQGRSDSSAWSRGQAWGVTGPAFAYSHCKEDGIMKNYCSIVDYYVNNLPDDYVAYWDLSFTSGDEPRDSSAAAIAVCGLLEACKIMPLDDEHRKLYMETAEKIMNSLIEGYTTKDDPKSNGLLKHATYYYAGNLGIDECNIWGDYFYMEALMRFLNPNWKKYW
ncbi:MAG: glycoside hydrolase family 88 protein [Clostridia bacterium]|nr:glycoside hydrolase family 88 protein [Clostridia bacterium]